MCFLPKQFGLDSGNAILFCQQWCVAPDGFRNDSELLVTQN